MFGRYAFGMAPFGIDHLAENIEGVLVLSDGDLLGVDGHILARSDLTFLVGDLISTVPCLSARSNIAFLDSDAFDFDGEVVIDKFLRLINASTARRVYVVEMAIRRFQ